MLIVSSQLCGDARGGILAGFGAIPSPPDRRDVSADPRDRPRASISRAVISGSVTDYLGG